MPTFSNEIGKLGGGKALLILEFVHLVRSEKEMFMSLFQTKLKG